MSPSPLVLNRSTICRIWHRAAVDLSDKLHPYQSVCSRKKGRSSRNLKHDSAAARLKLVPKARRTTFRSIAAAMSMPKSILHDYYRRGIFVEYSSSVKPALTDSNKAVQLKWAIDHVHPHDGLCPCRRKVVLRHASYLVPDEAPPHRTVKSKTFITKVMFLSTVARPRWDHDNDEWFDGNIGTWHFMERVPALRGSRNRPAGTMVTKPVSVTREVYRTMLLDNVIPAVKAKWPQGETKGVIIQQDNGKLHVPLSNPRIVAACTGGGWAMQVRFQAPNSPDLNVLDLGFFRALQTLQERNYSRNIDDIITATDEAWQDVDMITLNANFLTLQCCMQEIMRVEGDNCYKIPHMKKAKLDAVGMLPEVVCVDRDLFDDGCRLLSATDFDNKIDELALEVAQAMDLSEFSSQMEKLSVDGELEDDIDLDLALLLGIDLLL
ncbi:hypothetical protein H257_14801 [Aphanomyces astaci]|uniref:Transposase Tc1-like domain-containing protein n=1 Tax=Aphanomyces astaci TaxID=112090 RepID=W4FQ27_APHAT|nr:hypothetical protein H257_14801 [Aphanomyces astaci]ETV69565.1 hypothetical protein H257_14801 [Aphanomyces astaci]|eukprot:XP_009840989.1 hypothetical protein H257_14801 [Aphanomyces astaci]